MSAHESPAAREALALARSGDRPSELIHVAAGAPLYDLDRGRWFTWHRGGTVRAWADPGRTVWVFQLRGAWCSTQGVFTAPA